MKRIYLLVFIFFLSGCKEKKETYHGYVEGNYQYIAASSAGFLEHLFVERGKDINEGEPLFSLNPSLLKASLEQARFTVEQNQALVDENRIEYERAKALLQRQSISQADLDKKESLFRASEAQLLAAKQGVLIAQRLLQESFPHAVKSGTVIDTYYLKGEYVNAGQPVVSLLSPEDIKIRFFIPQKMLSSISIGQEVSVQSDGDFSPVSAYISYIASAAEYTPPMIYSLESRSKWVFLVEAQLTKTSLDMKPGLPVDVSILRS